MKGGTGRETVRKRLVIVSCTGYDPFYTIKYQPYTAVWSNFFYDYFIGLKNCSGSTKNGIACQNKIKEKTRNSEG